MSKPILGYWNYRGFGNPIRFICAYAEIDYEEKRYKIGPPPNYNWDEWLEDKYSLELDFPNVPYWIDGGLKLTQLLAIMKHLARTHAPELLPSSDDISAAHADMLDTIVVGDLFNELGTLCYGYTEELMKEFKVQQPKRLGQVSAFLGSKNWLLGNNISYIDFILYEALYSHQMYDQKLLQPFPNFSDYMKRFEQLPAIRIYMNDPNFIVKPCFSPKATIKI